MIQKDTNRGSLKQRLSCITATAVDGGISKDAASKENKREREFGV